MSNAPKTCEIKKRFIGMMKHRIGESCDAKDSGERTRLAALVLATLCSRFPCGKRARRPQGDGYS